MQQIPPIGSKANEQKYQRNIKIRAYQLIEVIIIVYSNLHYSNFVRTSVITQVKVKIWTKNMFQVKASEQRRSKQVFQVFQKDYVRYLKQLLPESFLQQQRGVNKSSPKKIVHASSSLSLFNQRSGKNYSRNKGNLNKNRPGSSQTEKHNSYLEQFILKVVKKIAKQKTIDEYSGLEAITKQLGIDVTQLNRMDKDQTKIQYMLFSIDRSIQDQKKKLLCTSKTNAQGNTFASSQGQQKPCSFVVSTNNSTTYKGNNYVQNNQVGQKVTSKYQSFIREQNKKQADNFAWLQINTKYPLLEKKLKSKLIQSINQDKNQKRIRDLIEKKQNSKKIKYSSSFSNKSALSNSSLCWGQSTSLKQAQARISRGQSGRQGQARIGRSNRHVDIDEEKVDLIDQCLFMEQFQKSKIDYIWTDNDEKMFLKNTKDLKQKCSTNNQFLKLCGRFKFISQGEFQTLASQQISRMLNKNNKIYMSRQFLLDKYYSTTQVLTQQEMRFILKTSPMLSKCVDRNFIKSAIKNIRYENISDLQLKIAQDIIGRFQILRNSVRESRKAYKQSANKATKERIIQFERDKQLKIAQQIAREQLKDHKLHFVRSLNYENRRPSSGTKSTKGLSKKTTANIWTPLNKYHPSTGLFVKDCNQQCTDDLFNSYQKQYLKKVQETKVVPKKNTSNRVEMIKFYTGGPNQNITTNFNPTQADISNICSIIKAFCFEKKILVALQAIEISAPENQFTRKQECKTTMVDIRTKKTLIYSAQEEFQIMAKKKLIQNKHKARQAVYVSKLLSLAAENAFLSLKALDPQFTAQQVNSKDRKGNTALFYACRFNNQEFAQFLMNFGANPNMTCQKQNSPLHLAFKSNNILLILRLLTCAGHPPNLNILNSQFKTPLAQCSIGILKKLNLEQGVTNVDPNLPSMVFDNNALLQKGEFHKIKEKPLQVVIQFRKKARQNKGIRYNSSTMTSIQNMGLQ